MLNIKYLKQIGKYWFIPLVLVIFSSCTDVDETINSEVTDDQFFQNEQQFTSALGDAYAILGTGGGSAPGLGGHNGFTSMYEISADQALVTHKGPDWEDGGLWLRMHRHKFRPDEVAINNAWIFLFSGVNSSNRLISQFEQLIKDGSVDEELANGFIAELETLRSFYYLQLLDTFGNVPILRSFEDENPTNNDDFQAGRTEVFNFVKNTITANLGRLSTDVGATYGRMNKFVGHMMLARLYMNAEVYIGEPKWEEALAHLDTVSQGGYSLADNYSANFVTNNSGSPEIIFAVPYDNVNLTGFNLHQMTLHYQQQAKFQMQSQPWNGYSTLSEFYNSHIDPEQNPGPQGDVIGLDGQPGKTGTQDDRLANFSVGLQEDNTGNVITDASFEVTNDASDAQRGTVDENPELRLTPKIDELEPNANRQAGARITKYEIEQGALPDLNNDFIIYRYADVLLLKAEARMRLNSESDLMALQYVNRIRERAGVDDFTNLTFDKLLAERGREMFYEVTRRSDLIRFDGKEGATRFNDSWRFKDDVSEEFRNRFPIPQDQLEANSSLTQNPGDWEN